MMVLPKRRLRRASTFVQSDSSTQQQTSNLSVLTLKGCSSVVHPSSDTEKSSSSPVSTIRLPSLSPSSSSSPSLSPPGSFKNSIIIPPLPSDASSPNLSPSSKLYASSVSSSPARVGGSNKPHKSQDAAWESVQYLRTEEGVLDIGNFKLLQRVGGGDIGNVFLSELVGSSGQRFAIKVMDKEHLVKRNKLFRITTERKILEMLDHPFLPTLYGWFETSEYACFVMEFCPGGDLHKLRQRQPDKRFDEDSVRFYAAEVLLAIEYLHMMGVVYRDLKPENVLIREDGHIMLTDFDLSLQFDTNPRLLKPNRLQSLGPDLSPFLSCANPSKARTVSCVPSSRFLKRNSSLPTRSSKQNENASLTRSSSSLPQLNVEPLNVRSMSFVGTHEYLAPEIIAGGGHGSAVDWWTLGVFIYELLYGTTPFKGLNNDATLMNAFSKSLVFPSDVHVSQCAKDLIKSLLVKEPRRRLGFSRGAGDIKTHPFFEDINWPLIRWSQPPQIPKPFELNQSSEQPSANFECF